jgi:hypothetical protein
MLKSARASSNADLYDAVKQAFVQKAVDIDHELDLRIGSWRHHFFEATR